MFESNQAAAQVMKDRNKFPSCTRHAYTLEFYRFLPAPSYSAQAIYGQDTRTQFLKSSKKAQIEGLKAEVDELHGKVEELKPILNQKRREEADLRKKYDGMVSLQERKRNDLVGIDRALRDNESKKYVEPDVASHVSLLIMLYNVIMLLCNVI